MGGSVDPAFVGREAELASLISTWDRAASGQGVAVIVGGEAGIGKTSLLDRFTILVAERGSITLTGAALEFSGRGLPYGPFAEAFRTLVHAMEPARVPAMLGPGRRGLSVLLLDLAGGEGEAGLALADQDRHAQARLFESVLNVLEHLSTGPPSVVVIEDVQWSDDDTRDLLRYLMRNLRAARVLLIVSVRTDDARRDRRVLSFLAECERDPWVTRIELAPFDRTELTRLVASRGVVQDASGEIVDELLVRSGGNPFYAAQLLALPRDAREAALPSALRDILSARLADLPQAARSVIEGIAVSGGAADEAILQAVLSLSPVELSFGLAEAVRRGIVVVADGPSEYRIGHALLREFVYSELLPGDRRRLHEAFATRLLAIRASGGLVEAAVLAFHLDRANDSDHAIPALVDAGKDAERAYAFGQARGHFERALELWRSTTMRPATDVDRVWLMQHAADAAVAAGAYGRAIDLGRQAVTELMSSTSSTRSDSLRLAELHQRLRWYQWEAGDREAASEAVSAGLREVPVSPPSTTRARLLAEAAGIKLTAGDMHAARQLASEAFAVARASGGRVEAALAGGILGWSIAVLGSEDEGIATFKAALRAADAVGGAEGKALGRANLAALFDRIGRSEDGLQVALDGYDTVERLGFTRTYGGELLGWAAKALLDLGRWDEARARIEQGLERSGVGRAAVELHVAGARLETYRGNWEAAWEHVRRARELDTGTGLWGLALEILSVEAELAVLMARRDDARAAVDAAASLYQDDLPVDPALAWAAAVALRGEADAAEEARARHAEREIALARDRVASLMDLVERAAVRQLSIVAVTDPRYAAMADLCRAEAGRAMGRPDPDQWTRVVDRFVALGRPYPAAYGRYRLAEAILHEGGPRSKAAEAALAAHLAARELGAAPLLADIKLLARHARIELETPRPGVRNDAGTTDAFGLTPREGEVIRLLAAGWSNQEIADALFITRKTASVHVSNILAKYGVRNRVEAAAIAQRLGLGRDAPLPPKPGGSA